MILDIPIQADKASDFFANPDLDPVDADRAALGWISHYKMIEKSGLPNHPTSIAIKDRTKDALRQYKEYRGFSNTPLFANKAEARQRVRAEKIDGNLDKWSRLFSDDGFDAAIDEYGLKDKYDRAVEMTGSRDLIRDQYRKKLFLKEVVGRFDDLGQAWTAKNLLKIDDPNDESFVSGARTWVSNQITHKTTIKEAQEDAIDLMIGGAGGDEIMGKMREYRDFDPDAGKVFRQTVTQFDQEYGKILPLVRRLVSAKKAEGERGLFQEKSDLEAPQPGTIARIYMREGGREKFLFLLGKVMEKEGGEVDLSGFTKFFKSAGRSAEGMAEGLGRSFMRNNAKDNAEERSDEENRYWQAVNQVVTDTKNVKAAVAEVKGSNWFSQMMYDTASSLPYMTMMANPIGMVAAGLSVQQEHFEEIKRIDPNVSDDDALWVATASAPIEVGIEKLQLSALGGKFPGIQSAADKLLKGGLLKRWAVTAAAEYTQETLQDAVLPTVMDITNVLKKEIPKGDWSDFEVMDSRRFFAVLPLSLLGAGGQVARDKFTSQEVGQILSDESNLRMSGATAEEAKSIIEKAKVNPDAALTEFKEVVMSKSVEERNKIGDEALEEAMGIDPTVMESIPLVIPSDGGFRVKFPDGREEFANSPEEAQVMVDQSFRDDFVSNAEAVKDFIGSMKERAEGDNEVKKVGKMSLKDLVQMGYDTEANAKKAVAVYLQQSGQTVPANIDLGQYFEQGSVKMRRKMAGFSVRIAEGASPLTVAEEFSEGFLRMIVGRGDMTFDQVKGLLDEFGEVSGLDMTPGYDVDPERAVIEGFSKFAQAYLLQGDYASVPESTRNWMTKAWNFLENPSAVPKPLRAAVEFFTKLLKSVFDVAKAIEFFRKDGNGINPELEGLAMRALGLDEKAYNDRMEEEYRRELMEEVFPPEEELSQQIKGKLPHPADMEGEVFHGELVTIWEAMGKETRKKDKRGRRVMSYAKAQNFFAKKGQGETDLDDLRQQMNELGFRFLTPGEMLDAVLDSVEGRKVFPVALGGEMVGPTWSIISAQDAEYLSAVESGDMDKAQAMVDEAAKKAGGIFAWRSMSGPKDGSDTFSKEIFDSGKFFTSKEVVAEGFGNGSTSRYYLFFNNPLTIDSNGRNFYEAANLNSIGSLSKDEVEAIKSTSSLYLSRSEYAPGKGGNFFEYPLESKEINKGFNLGPEGIARLAFYRGHDGVIVQNIKEGGKSKDVISDTFIARAANQIKSADPVTYDDKGDVIPLSERFNEKDDRITYSIQSAPDAENAEDAITRLFAGPTGMIEAGKKMREKLAKIREGYEAKMFGREFEDADTREIETLNTLMRLNAIASVLPPEVRASVGSPIPLVNLKTDKARERNIIERLERISDALEKTLRKGFREKLKKLIDKSTAKKDKATRRRTSKIGVVGHLVADAAVDAMTMTAIEAQKLADGIREAYELEENPTLEMMEEAEGKALAYELFSDYDNADAARLERAAEFLELNYSENRKEWLAKLKERKDLREKRASLLIAGIGATDFTGAADLSRSKSKDKKLKGPRSFAQQLLSFYQMLDLIAEKTKSEEVRGVVNEMAGAFRRARNAYSDTLEARQEQVIDKIGEILGVTSGVNKAARINGKLVKLSKAQEVNVTLRTGRRPETIKVDKHIVDSILRGEVAGNPKDPFSEADLTALEKAWEAFEDLPEAVQNRRKKVEFIRRHPDGPREGIGTYSQLDLAKEWLALQQQDAKEKYELSGWDEITLREIEREMLPETRQIAKFLQDYLREMTPEMDSIHREEYGLALGAIENYFPLLFDVVGNEKEISMDGNNVTVSARKGSFLKSRVSHAAMPKQANALAVMQSHLASAEFWKTHAPLMREWGGVLKSQNLQHAMKAKLGETFVQNLNSWLTTIEANGQGQALANLVADKMVRKLQGGLALSVLGMRLRTVMVNMTAGLNVLFQVPFTKLVKGMGPTAFKDVVTLAKSPTFQRRLKSGGSYEATVALEQRLGGGLVATTLRRAAQLGMQPINYADTLTNLSTALAYRAQVVENRKAGMSEEEAQAQALDYVDEIITRVAQPTDMLSRSLFENEIRGKMSGILFLFASEARKNTALMGNALRTVITGKGVYSRSMAAQQLMVGTLLYSTMGYVLKALVEAAVKNEDDEDEDYLDRVMEKLTDSKAITHAMATEHLRGLPILGEAWSYGTAKTINAIDALEGDDVKTFESSSNPLLRQLKGAGKVEKVFTAENADEAVDNLIDSIQAFASILPETAVFAQAGNLAEDGLGLWRNVTGETISDDEAVKRTISRINRQKDQIYEETRPQYQSDNRRERKEAEMSRDEQVLNLLENQKAEMSPEMWNQVIERLKDKKEVPMRILDQID